MTGRLSSMVILAGLVMTPATNLHAQSNPWYIPPQAPVQAQPSMPAQQITPPFVPQTYTQAPQYGFGAGYVVQPPTSTTIVVPQTSALPQPSFAGYGYAQQPATTGTVASVPTPTGAPPYAAATPGGIVAYQVAPAAAAPHYAPQTQAAVPQQPAPVYVVPQQPATSQVYAYQPHVQVLGNYPPLGGDPTVPAHQPAQQPSQPQQSAPPVPATAPAWGSTSALQYPGFAGPTTLSPGYGGYPGLSPIYPAPYGATPYLGLPF